jgi:hypothetical protein
VAYEDHGVPGARYRDAEDAALLRDAPGIPVPVKQLGVVLSFDDEDGVELLSLRLVNVHHRDRVGLGGAARDELVGEDAADRVGGTR